jgi:hypothetical protein
MSAVNKKKRRNDMRARLTKLGAGLAALAALAVGGSALASAAGSGSQPTKAPALFQQNSAKAADPVEANDPDPIQNENGSDDATEAAGGVENETAGAAESGSEVPGNDGPGGWADEPANPNADTQQQGEH